MANQTRINVLHLFFHKFGQIIVHVLYVVFANRRRRLNRLLHFFHHLLVLGNLRIY